MSISVSEVVGITFFLWNYDFRMYVYLIMLLTNFFYLLIYVACLFRAGTSSFCIARFCVCFGFFLECLGGIDIIFHGSKLLKVF